MFSHFNSAKQGADVTSLRQDVIYEFLTVEQVGIKLQLDVQSVRNLIKAGHLRAYRFGKLFRIKPWDLEVFVEACQI